MALRILSSRVPVNGEGNHTCKISRVGTAYNKDGVLLHIVDTNLITQKQLAVAKSEFQAGNYEEACNQRMSFISQFKPAYTPAKQEVCIARVEESEGALYVRGFQAVPVVSGSKLGAGFFEESEDSAPVEQAVVKGVKTK